MNIFLTLLSKLAPLTVAKLLYKRISTPQKRKIREFESTILERAKKRSIKFKDHELQGYSWGIQNNPTILFIHGWGGHAGNFGALVTMLTAKGYHVCAYDGPSHGYSSTGKTSMFEYTDFISERIQTLEPTIIISHSFGTVSTILALLKKPNFSPNQWIIVTTPFSFKEYIESMTNKLGISQKAVRILATFIERDAGIPLEDITMKQIGSRLKLTTSSLIIHSKDDKVLPICDAERTSRELEGSELLILEGLGHYNILWSDDLKKIIAKKIVPLTKHSFKKEPNSLQKSEGV